MGKASAEARRRKATEEPTLDNVPPFNARSTHVEQINVNEINGNEIKVDQSKAENINNDRLIDNDALSSSSNQNPSSGFAAAPTGPVTPTTRPPANDPVAAAGEAAQLVDLLHFLLSQRKDEVVIRPDYSKLWTKDFDAALRLHSYADLRQAVIFSQLPRNQKYFKRSASICAKLDSLLEQCLEPRAESEIRTLWALAEKGRLPAPKKESDPDEEKAATPATHEQSVAGLRRGFTNKKV